jgi:hypothetical protein
MAVFKRTSGTEELRKFVRQFPKFPAEIRREIRPMLRKIGQPALTAARQNASYSTRIPKATKLSVLLSKKGAGLRLTTSIAAADDSRALEHRGQPGMFRHPVNPSKTVWVNQKARPFLWPAVEPITKSVDNEIGTIVDQVARAHGFRGR